MSDGNSTTNAPPQVAVTVDGEDVCQVKPPCVPLEDHCHECNGTQTACIKCRDSYHLYEGECHETCPNGTYWTGTGQNFGRQCEITRGCVVGLGICHTCSEDTSVCVQCNNRTHLYEGKCYRTCPNGTVWTGSGRIYGRECGEKETTDEPIILEYECDSQTVTPTGTDVDGATCK